MSLSPRHLRQRVLKNFKILARLEGRTNPWPPTSADVDRRSRNVSTPRRPHGFFRCNLTIACPSAVCLGSPFHACP